MKNFILHLLFLGSPLLLVAVPGQAQEAAEIEQVKAAVLAYYNALAAKDNARLSQTQAKQPYATHIGSNPVSIVHGSDAILDYNAKILPTIEKLTIVVEDFLEVQVRGEIAWTVDRARVEFALQGNKGEYTAFSTNILEKQDDEWLIVSRQVTRKKE